MAALQCTYKKSGGTIDELGDNLRAHKSHSTANEKAVALV
jgi:hypothetical protein